MSWPSCTYRGVTYTFHHLVPFTAIAHGKRIRVSCGAHAFTTAHRPTHPADLNFLDGKTVRTFDETRYLHSTHLPTVLMAAFNGPVYSNARRLVFKGTILGIKETYVVAFDMRKSNSPKYDFKVQIVSAHLTSKVKQMPKAQFNQALAAMASSSPVVWTKK